MSRNGSGTYSLPAGNPVVTNTTISSTWANTTLNDIATALTNSVATDGQSTMTGNLQMGNNKITGVDDGTSAADAATYGQLVGLTGRVLQTVKFVTDVKTTTTGTTWVNSALTASITPTSASSKIYVFVSASQNIYSYATEMNTRIVRGASTEVSGSYRLFKAYFPTEGGTQDLWIPSATIVEDSPASTAATSYTVQFRCQAVSGGTVAYGSNDTNASCIILMEIL